MDQEDARQLLLAVFRADRLLPPELLDLLDRLTAPAAPAAPADD